MISTRLSSQGLDAGTGGPRLAGGDMVSFGTAFFSTFPDVFSAALEQLVRGAPSDSLSFELTPPDRRSWPWRGVRHFLSEKEGDGYWDLFKLSEHLFVTVTDATYRERKPIRIEGEGYFKLRILLTGELLEESGKRIIQGPRGALYLSPHHGRNAYLIGAGVATRLVILHARRELLNETLGIAPEDIPYPFASLFAANERSSMLQVALNPEVFRAAQRIIDSRLEVASKLRIQYLSGLCQVILCEVIGDLINGERIRRTRSGMTARDHNRLLEVRSYLAQNYREPPGIAEIARRVGINQTKLKASFREAFSVTIYDYIQRCRMERASELLLSGDYGVAEVAYKVGYGHAANFTHAFKRYFGKLPRAWKQR